jgi:DNA-binding CsgD family transcriptional regulator
VTESTPNRNAEIGPSPNYCDLLAQRLLRYTREVPSAGTPKEVLERLHAITLPSLNLNVLWAMRLPQRSMDWDSLIVGESVFPNGKLAEQCWEEWIRLAPHKVPVGLALASSSLAPLTMTDFLQVLQPIGGDRWAIDLALKHGIRDGLVCPIGGRWLVYFWSSKPIVMSFSEETKVLIFAAASFAAIRLQQLTGSGPASRHFSLTPREIAVLRLLSSGMPFTEVATYLGLGTETIRTHLKNAQRKLSARNRAHAIAEAIRHHFII